MVYAVKFIMVMVIVACGGLYVVGRWFAKGVVVGGFFPKGACFCSGCSGSRSFCGEIE